ncbi:hypothetical protein [Azorhizobium caulinodans]|uniref:hypothetical protein n=1 Tax=Azorhizobium caulinodans TaxID=7 RepID=UPI0002E616B4|nr:hypothetical protein [Azorhizobium caulinodans]
MRGFRILALCSSLLGTGFPSLAIAQGRSAAELAGLPADVRTFIQRRDGCDHFRGEEATDPERATFLAAQLKKLCTGTDAQLARLRKSYAANPVVIRALADYEPNIE